MEVSIAVTFYIFLWEHIDDRIVKIGLHLLKLWPKLECLVFFQDKMYIDSTFRVVPTFADFARRDSTFPVQ